MKNTRIEFDQSIDLSESLSLPESLEELFENRNEFKIKNLIKNEFNFENIEIKDEFENQKKIYLKFGIKNTDNIIKEESSHLEQSTLENNKIMISFMIDKNSMNIGDHLNSDSKKSLNFENKKIVLKSSRFVNSSLIKKEAIFLFSEKKTEQDFHLSEEITIENTTRYVDHLNNFQLNEVEEKDRKKEDIKHEEYLGEPQNLNEFTHPIPSQNCFFFQHHQNNDKDLEKKDGINSNFSSLFVAQNKNDEDNQKSYHQNLELELVGLKKFSSFINKEHETNKDLNQTIKNKKDNFEESEHKIKNENIKKDNEINILQSDELKIDESKSKKETYFNWEKKIRNFSPDSMIEKKMNFIKNIKRIQLERIDFCDDIRTEKNFSNIYDNKKFGLCKLLKRCKTKNQKPHISEMSENSKIFSLKLITNKFGIEMLNNRKNSTNENKLYENSCFLKKINTIKGIDNKKYENIADDNLSRKDLHKTQSIKQHKKTSKIENTENIIRKLKNKSKSFLNKQKEGSNCWVLLNKYPKSSKSLKHISNQILIKNLKFQKTNLRSQYLINNYVRKNTSHKKELSEKSKYKTTRKISHFEFMFNKSKNSSNNKIENNMVKSKPTRSINKNIYDRNKEKIILKSRFILDDNFFPDYNKENLSFKKINKVNIKIEDIYKNKNYLYKNNKLSNLNEKKEKKILLYNKIKNNHVVRL